MALNEGKVTQAGLRLLAKVTAGTKLELTKFAVGDGDLGTRDPLTLTDLVRRLYNYPVARISSNSNAATVTFNFSNQVVGTGFYWKEIGLWARDPDVGEILFMYANSGAAAAEYIPAGGSSTILERQFNWRLVGSNASAITATIDQSLMYASQDDLTALAKQSLQVRSIDAAYTTLAQMQQPGVYIISQVSGYSDRPVYESGVAAIGTASLLVKRNPALTTDYDVMQMIEIAADAALHVFIRRIVVASGTSTIGGWVRVMNAGGGTFTEAVTINKTLTVKGKITGGSGTFTDTIDIAAAVPLVFRHPTSTATRPWVMHIESSDGGGYLHISPERADKAGWDFDKGIRIDGSTGDLYVKNTISAFDNKLWVNPQRGYGSTAQYTLSIVDSDSGFNWVRDGNLEWRSNGEIMAYVLNESGTKGLFAPTTDGTANYHLANEIQSLKQSGVNYKKSLVSYINAAGIAATTDEGMSVLIERAGQLARQRYKEATVTRGSAQSGADYLTIPAGFYTKVTGGYFMTFGNTLGIMNFAVSSGSSFTIYALDADGRQTDIFTGSTSGRNYTLYGIQAFAGGASVCVKDNSSNASVTWTQSIFGGFRTEGGVRFRYRITGSVTVTTTETSGNFPCWGG